MRQEQGPYSGLPWWLKLITVLATLGVIWAIFFITRNAVLKLSDPALYLAGAATVAVIIGLFIWGRLLERSRRNREGRLGSSSGSDVNIERLKDVGKHPTGRGGISE